MYPELTKILSQCKESCIAHFQPWFLQKQKRVRVTAVQVANMSSGGTANITAAASPGSPGLSSSTGYSAELSRWLLGHIGVEQFPPTLTQRMPSPAETAYM